jgi:hypothetical protein
VNLRNRFPASLAQLTSEITAGGTALGGLSYNAAHASRWDGPYIDAAVGDSITSGYDAAIHNTLLLYDADASHAGTAPVSPAPSLAAADFVALSVTALDSASYARVNGLLDGEADTAAGNGYATGKFRALSANPATAYYLVAPFRQ